MRNFLMTEKLKEIQNKFKEKEITKNVKYVPEWIATEITEKLSEEFLMQNPEEFLGYFFRGISLKTKFLKNTERNAAEIARECKKYI